MKKRRRYDFSKIICTSIVLSLMVALTSCYHQRERVYYSDKNNFISTTAEITYVNYNSSYSALYLSFSENPEKFYENDFKIIEKNWEIIKRNGGEKKLEVGEEITFISAPWIFGDGYVMPIVAVSCGEEVYLEFEEGYANFMEQYK